MSLLRKFYTEKQTGLSTQNEPGNKYYLFSNVQQYPDMYSAYLNFSKLFNLNLTNFILANGCENALKNTLLALKIKNLNFNYPTWQMIEVLCTALDISFNKFEFFYKNNRILDNTSLYQINTQAIYTNLGCTNYFKYEYDINLLNNSYSNYNIIDLTYKSIKECKTLIPILLKNPKNIIVGSFDKCIGCGLRLGYAIYNEKYNNDFQLQREQYINALACKYLINNKFKDINNMYKYLLQNNSKIFQITNNFLNINYLIDTNLPNKKFTIQKHTFTRFGIPKSISEFIKLQRILK